MVRAILIFKPTSSVWKSFQLLHHPLKIHFSSPISTDLTKTQMRIWHWSLLTNQGSAQPPQNLSTHLKVNSCLFSTNPTLPSSSLSKSRDTSRSSQGFCGLWDQLWAAPIKQKVIKITSLVFVFFSFFLFFCLKNCKHWKPQVNAAQPLHTMLSQTKSCRNSTGKTGIWGESSALILLLLNTHKVLENKPQDLVQFLETELQYWH